MIHTQVTDTHKTSPRAQIINLVSNIMFFLVVPLEETEVTVFRSRATSVQMHNNQRRQESSLEVWKQPKKRFIPQLRANDHVSFAPQMSAVWAISTLFMPSFHSSCPAHLQISLFSSPAAIYTT